MANIHRIKSRAEVGRLRYRPSKRLVDDSNAFTLDFAGRELSRDASALASPTHFAKIAQYVFHEQLRRIEKRLEKIHNKTQKTDNSDISDLTDSELSTFKIA